MKITDKNLQEALARCSAEEHSLITAIIGEAPWTQTDAQRRLVLAALRKIRAILKRKVRNK